MKCNFDMLQYETVERTVSSPLRLAVIADDMTGALDTGVQFSKRGARTAVIPAGQLLCPPDIQVAVVNAETRHLPPEAAYVKTRRIAAWALQAGAGHLYIKTDSGMRGNIGAALKAALDASGQSIAAFAPAYPDMNRLTIDGCQYIDGVPIDQSVFGLDPVDPVRYSRVSDIIAWGGLRTIAVPRNGTVSDSAVGPAVWIFDVQENADFVRIAKLLQLRGALQVTAGCAAFASALVPWLDLPVQWPMPIAPAQEPLLVLCGSLNPITRQQMLYGVHQGMWHMALDSSLLLRADWRDACRDTISAVEQQMRQGRSVLLDTCGITNEENARSSFGLIANRMGSLAEYLLSLPQAAAYTPMFIGGDTLMGFLSRKNVTNIRIEGEAAPGVVAFQVTANGRSLRMLSKSGGFGKETLLWDMVAPGRIERC